MSTFNKPLFFCLLIIGVAFASTLAASLSVPLPIGADTFFHLKIAGMIHQGNAVGAWNFILHENLFPYGLMLFQIGESIFFVSDPYLVVKVLQVLLLPATLALTMWVVYKYASPKAAVYCGATLFASWAFFDGALQVRPESVDLLFYPLLLAAVLVGAKWRFVGLAVAAVYSHGLAAFSMLYGLVVHKLRERSWLAPLVVGVAALLPVIILSVLYVGGAFAKWGGAPPTENPQEVLFWTDPTWIPYYMGATLLGVPFLLKRGKTLLEKVALAGLVGNLLMLPLWADRFLHYSSLPLAIFAGVGIAGLKNPQHRYYFAMALLTVYIVYTVSFFGFSFGFLGHWWQPGN